MNCYHTNTHLLPRANPAQKKVLRFQHRTRELKTKVTRVLPDGSEVTIRVGDVSFTFGLNKKHNVVKLDEIIEAHELDYKLLRVPRNAFVAAKRQAFAILMDYQKRIQMQLAELTLDLKAR